MKLRLTIILIAVTLCTSFLFYEQVKLCKELIDKAYHINNRYIHMFLDNCSGTTYHCVMATVQLERNLNEESDKVLEENSCLWLKQY